MDAARCYLCDHQFVEGEEPWLMFEQRLREDGQPDSTLAELLGEILEQQPDEQDGHSPFLCDSCNADVMEYNSLLTRFKHVRERILTYYKENATINNLVMHDDINKVMKIEMDSQDQDNLEFVAENGAALEADLVEEVPENDPDIGSHSFDFTAFNEQVGENSFPSGGLDLSDSLVNLAVSGTSVDVQDEPIDDKGIHINLSNSLHTILKFVPTTFPDIIIYELYDKVIQANDMKPTTGDDQNQDLQSYSSTEDSNFVFINPSNANELDIEGDGNDNALEKTSVTVYSEPTPVCKAQGKAFVCLLCDPSPSLAADVLGEHLLNFHEILHYMCEVCNQGYAGRQELKDHTDIKHSAINSKPKQYYCGVCSRSFTSHLLLRLHKRTHTHHGGGAKSHECKVCCKKYNTKGMLDEHMNTHTGLRPYKCSECSKDFASKYTLQSHMKIHTERNRPYQCDQCEKAFLNQQNLNQHKKLHVPFKAFKCEVCSKSFITQHSLNVHLIVHSGQKPFLCRICGKAFARRPEIKDHERTHTGERPFQCDLCPMAFAQRSNLNTHKKNTHFNEKQHKCNQCERSFKRRRLLYYHVLAIHTGERPLKCNICGAGFVYPEHYKKHMLIHSGAKPFACEVCGKQFNSRDNRNAHRFVHSDKKPYECMECGAGFMRKPLLLAHMKQTKHVSDTIIVNQPQFTNLPSLVREIVTEPSAVVEDGSGLLENCDDTLVQIDGNEAISEKYLKFADLDSDGSQTLAWVDIGGNDDSINNKQ
uniref:C2H2-type domain-containing protein n=1 Tax=Glossina palpalis gambiensis TaxID=67801 RepID=A0A1B0BLM7_9MUSC